MFEIVIFTKFASRILSIVVLLDGILNVLLSLVAPRRSSGLREDLR